MKKITGILSALVLALALLPATVFAAEDVAKIDNGTTFETLEAAVSAVADGGTVTLLKDATGSGIGTYKFPNAGQIAAKSFTIDFGGFTYTATDPAAGSTNTETQAFHLEWSGMGDANHNVTLKNGTIEAAKGTQNVKMLVQNYCNLTLDNMVLDGTNLQGSMPYTMSNNCGNVTIKDTIITAADNGVAFDVYGGFGSYGDVTVTVTGNSVVNGTVEVDRDTGTQNKNTLNIESGTIKGDLQVKENAQSVVSVSGGAFTDLANAVKYAADGAVIKLAGDVTNVGQANVKNNITVDLGGNTVTFTKFGFVASKNLTLKNGAVKAGMSAVYAMNGANVLIEKDAKLHSEKNGTLVLVNNGTTATVYGTIEADKDSAISGVGNKADGGVIINVEDGAVLDCKDGVGIYYPNTAELNIKGGTITGLTGVYVKSGKTTVTGGTIIGTGAKTDYEYNGNGCNPTGDAFVVDKCNYPGGDPVVEIKGGTFKSEKANALASYTGNGAANALTGFVTGGFFSNDPSAFVSEGYTATKDAEGNYTVAKPTPGKPGAPMTYDAGIAIYGMSAVLSISGMAWLGLKKKGTDYVGKRMEK